MGWLVVLYERISLFQKKNCNIYVHLSVEICLKVFYEVTSDFSVDSDLPVVT